MASAEVEWPRPAGLAPGLERLYFAESNSVLWTWAWPHLAIPGREVTWLFSPVTGNTIWPGDLWGVDDHGDLFIVEAKTCRPGRPVDPLADFVKSGASVTRGLATSTSATALRARWQKLYAKELAFIQSNRVALADGTPIDGLHPGIVPYGRHRAAVQRWADLYLKRIAPRITASSYLARVKRALSRREQLGNAPPIIVGLLSCVEGTAPRLSAKGLAHLASLRQMREARSIFVTSITAQVIGATVSIHTHQVRSIGLLAL